MINSKKLSYFVLGLLLGWLMMAQAVTAATQDEKIQLTGQAIVLHLDSPIAHVMDKTITLSTPPMLLDDRTYVPARFLAEQFGWRVEWHHQEKIAHIYDAALHVTVDFMQQTASVNAQPQPFGDFARLVNEQLFLPLRWFAEQSGAIVHYDAGRIEIWPYHEHEQARDPHTYLPIAKFHLPATTVKIGEPLQRHDLSYDPAGEGIVSRTYTGWPEEGAFFAAGKYDITLQVTNQRGQKSLPFTQTVHVIDEVWLSPKLYPLYTAPLGTVIKDKEPFRGLTSLAKKEQHGERQLLISNSPEQVQYPAILYADDADGEVRIYPYHVNMSDQPLYFAVIASNATPATVTLQVLQSGAAAPTPYANLLGYGALLDYWIQSSSNNPSPNPLILQPGQSQVLYRSELIHPGESMHAILDVKANATLRYTVIAYDPRITPEPVAALQYHVLPIGEPDQHIRGLYQHADTHWTVPDVKQQLQQATAQGALGLRLTIGDGELDPHPVGFDALRQQPVINRGSYGRIYTITLKQPGSAAILFLPRGGTFKGVALIDGKPLAIPRHGVITLVDGIYLLHRTSGEESQVELTFSPPGGSYMPFDIVVVPLEKHKVLTP